MAKRKPAVKQLRNGKKYIVTEPGYFGMVCIYRGCHMHPSLKTKLQLFVFDGSPDSGWWIDNKFGGVENDTCERKAAIDRMAEKWLEKNGIGGAR
jgi:hypothetical protein